MPNPFYLVCDSVERGSDLVFKSVDGKFLITAYSVVSGKGGHIEITDTGDHLSVELYPIADL